MTALGEAVVERTMARAIPLSVHVDLTMACNDSFHFNVGFFQERGLATVICGPGSIAQAHQPDEFVSVAQLDEGARFLRQLIRRLAA